MFIDRGPEMPHAVRTGGTTDTSIIVKLWSARPNRAGGSGHVRAIDMSLLPE